MADLRLMTNGNQDVFRYGLTKLDIGKYEDPTYLGFNIELDENSALFTDVLPFLEKHASERSELASRISVYKEFVNKIKQVFNSQESIVNPTDKTEFVKQHYINSISGLNFLTNKFTKWREDKLTVQMHEDISLYTSYIYHLYNNLVYSYENGRMILPENFLKFNLYIKISEMRDLTSIGKLLSQDPNDIAVVNALKNNVTSIIYKLYDCEFDFFQSIPFEESINQAGIDQPPPPHSIVQFDIFFKRVSRQIYTPLINKSISMNDDKVDLDLIIINRSGTQNTTGTNRDPSKTTIDESNNPVQKQQVETITSFKQEAFINEKSKKPSTLKTYDTESDKIQGITETNDLKGVEMEINNIKSFNSQYTTFYGTIKKSDLTKKELEKQLIDSNKKDSFFDDPQKALSEYHEKLGNVAESVVLIQLQKTKRLILQKRNELVREFVNDVSNKIGIQKIVPNNVYYNTDSLLQQSLDNLAGSVGSTVANDIISELTNNNIIPGLPKLGFINGL